VPDPNPQSDAGPSADGSPGADADPGGESGPRDRPALLAATPGTDAVLEKLARSPSSAGLLALLVTLIAVELLVRI